MNLSGICNDSEVTRYREHVRPGMTIIYQDMCNYEQFTVTAVDPAGMSLTSQETGDTDYQAFDSLQYGWKLLPSDKREIDQAEERQFLASWLEIGIKPSLLGQ